MNNLENLEQEIQEFLDGHIVKPEGILAQFNNDCVQATKQRLATYIVL